MIYACCESMLVGVYRCVQVTRTFLWENITPTACCNLLVFCLFSRFSAETKRAEEAVVVVAITNSTSHTKSFREGVYIP